MEHFCCISFGDGRNYSAEGHAFLRYSPAAHNLVVIDGLDSPVLDIRETPVVRREATPSMTWRFGNEEAPVRDPAWIREGFTSPALDYVEVEIQNYHEVPDVSSRRSVMMIDQKYIVVLDELSASQPHRYSHLLHYGSALNGKHANGTLTVGAQGARWLTENADGEPVSLQVRYVAPEVSIEESTWFTNMVGGSCTDCFMHPMTRAHAEGEDVEFFTLLFPQRGDEAEPTVVEERAAAHALARVQFGSHEDIHLVAHGDAPSLNAEGVLANARYIYLRKQGDELERITLKRGSQLSLDGSSYLEASRPVSLSFDVSHSARLMGNVAGAGAVELVVRWPSGAPIDLLATLDGAKVSADWADGFATLSLPSGGELVVEAYPQGAQPDGGLGDGGMGGSSNSGGVGGAFADAGMGDGGSLGTGAGSDGGCGCGIIPQGKGGAAIALIFMMGLGLRRRLRAHHAK